MDELLAKEEFNMKLLADLGEIKTVGEANDIAHRPFQSICTDLRAKLIFTRAEASRLDPDLAHRVDLAYGKAIR